MKQILDRFDEHWEFGTADFTLNDKQQFFKMYLEQSIKDALEACRVERPPLDVVKIAQDNNGFYIGTQRGWNLNTTQYDENVAKFLKGK